MYFSWSASPGPHDILIDGLTITAPGVYMTCGVTFYHSDAANPNAHDVMIRNVNLTSKAVDQGLLPWDNSLDRLTFEDWTLQGIRIGCQYECSSAVTGVVFRRWKSTGSEAGWVSTKGNPPPGVTFDNCSFPLIDGNRYLRQHDVQHHSWQQDRHRNARRGRSLVRVLRQQRSHDCATPDRVVRRPGDHVQSVHWDERYFYQEHVGRLGLDIHRQLVLYRSVFDHRDHDPVQ